MNDMTDDRSFRVGFFDSVAQADQAVRSLLADGFTKEQLAVICPQHLKDELLSSLPEARRPGSGATTAIVEGGAIGAVLGGIALAATAILTGGVGLLPAIPVLIGGGALAGGFSSLIAADGYGKEIGSYYLEAVRLGKIVVGVKIEGEGSEARLEQAERILTQAGGRAPASVVSA
jgi:hypothetical protein